MDILSSSPVKNVQRGSTTLLSGATSLDVTVSEINTSKSFLTSSFRLMDVYTDRIPSIKVLNETTLRVERNSSANESYIEWELVEYV